MVHSDRLLAEVPSCQELLPQDTREQPIALWGRNPPCAQRILVVPFFAFHLKSDVCDAAFCYVALLVDQQNIKRPAVLPNSWMWEKAHPSQIMMRTSSKGKLEKFALTMSSSRLVIHRPVGRLPLKKHILAFTWMAVINHNHCSWCVL